MKKFKLTVLVAAAAAVGQVSASDFDEQLLERKRLITEMQFRNEQLQIQASMAKAIKEMSDAGIIVDAKGTPLGIGDMELFAKEVRQRGGMGQRRDAGDPFGGGMPFPPPGAMGGPEGFFPQSGPTNDAPQRSERGSPGIEDIKKPTEEEKLQGKQVLRLSEVRANSVVLFTNDGFKEVRLGEKVYDQRLKSVGVDSATLSGKDGDRHLRIDWTKSVRYSDE